MSARDFYHEHVKNALIKEGWTITDEPFSLKWDERDAYIDLGAERLLLAEKEQELIAVEIKSFIGASKMHDLYIALGQYILYRQALLSVEPKRELYLAVRQEIYAEFLQRNDSERLLKAQQIKLIVFNEDSQEVNQWIS